MADAKETQAQLQFQQEINKVLQARMGILAAQEKALSSQVQLAVDMCKALKCEQLDDIEARLKTTREAMSAAAAEAGRMGDELGDAGDKAEKSLGNTASASESLKNSLKTGKGIVAGFAVGMIRGFGSAFQAIKNLSTGAFGLVKTFGRVSMSIATLPLTLLGNLFNLAQQGGGGPSPTKLALEEIRREMGGLATGAGAAAASSLEQFSGQLKNMAGTGLSVRKVFGIGREGLAAAMKHNLELMKALGPAVGSFNEVMKKSAVELSMYRKGLGITAEQQAQMLKHAQAVGRDPVDAQREFASMAIQMGEQFGESASAIGKDMAEMKSDFASFGTLSVRELGQAAVYARKLGLAVKDLTGLIGAFDDFETGAQNAAKLSQAFGMNIDAMKMMNAQNPAERMSLLQKAFKETGKSVEQMSRQELKMLAQQSGLSEEAAKLAFSQKGLSMSYDQVQKAGSKSEKKQLSQAEAMSKLADSIERVFGSGGGQQFKSFFNAFTSGFERGILKSKEFRGVFRNIRKSLKAVYWGGVEVGRMFVKMFPGVSQMLKGLKDLFDPKRYKDLMGKVKNVFGEFFTDLKTDPKAGVEKFIDRFKGIFKDFFHSGGPAAKTVMEGGKTFLKTLGAIFMAVVPILTDVLARAFDRVAEFIKNPPEIPGALTEMVKNLGVSFVNLLSVVWGRLAPTLGKIFYALFEKAQPYIQKAGVIALKLAVAKIILGAVQGALAGGLVTIVASKLSSFFGASFGDAGKKTGGIGKSFGELISGALSGVFEGMKGLFKTISSINAKDILKAAAITALVAVSFLPALAILAIGLTLLTTVLSPAVAMASIPVMMAIGAAALAIAVAAMALSKVNVGMISQAIIGAAAGAVLVVSGILILATALRLISGVFVGVDWSGVAEGMLGLAVSVAAIGMMALAAALLVADGGMIMAMGIVGLLAAAVFSHALIPFSDVMAGVSLALAAVSPDTKPFINMAIIIGSLAFMAVAAAAMTAVGPLGIAGMGLTLLFVLVLKGIFPHIKESVEGLGSIDMSAAMRSFVQLGVVFVSIAIIAAVAAIAGVASILGTAGMGYIAIFVLAMAALMPDVLAIFQQGTAQVDLATLAPDFVKMTKLFLEIAPMAGAAALAGLASLAALVTFIPMALFMKSTALLVSGPLNRLGQALVNAKIDKLIPYAEGLRATMEALLVVAHAAIPLGVVSFIGLGGVKDFVDDVMDNVTPAITRLNELDFDPAAVAAKVDVVAGILGAIGAIGNIAVSLASVDTGMFSSTRPSDTLGAANAFVSSLMAGVTDLVTTISATTLTEEGIKSATAIGKILGSIGELAKSLSPDPKTLEALKTNTLLTSGVTPENMKALTEHMVDMVGAVEQNIGPLIKEVTKAASQVGDPAQMLPKMDIVAKGIEVVTKFASSMGEAVKTMGGDVNELGSTKLGKRLKNVTNAVVSAIFSGDNSAFKRVFTGISEMASSIDDPKSLEPKIKIVADMFKVLGDFAGAMSSVMSLMPKEGAIAGGVGESPEAFKTRVTALVTGLGSIVDALITADGGGAIGNVFNGLASLVKQVSTKKINLAQVKSLGEMFKVLSSFSTVMKDIGALGAGEGGAIDAEKIKTTLTSINDALFGAEEGVMLKMLNGIHGLVNNENVKGLARAKAGIAGIKAGVETLKVIGKALSDLPNPSGFAGLSQGYFGADNSSGPVKTLISGLTLAIPVAAQVTGRGADTVIAALNQVKRVGDVMGTIPTADAFISSTQGVDAMLGIFVQLPERASQAVEAITESFNTLDNAIRTSPIANLETLVRLNDALQGQRSLRISTDAVNVNVHVQVKVDAVQVGQAIIDANERIAAAGSPKQKFVLG